MGIMNEMPLRNRRAFSFTELILASVLTGILMIAGTATISMMYQAATSFHNLIQSNLNWYDFTNQISADMHRASYVDLDNDTLTLYGYKDDIIATYTNFTEGVQYNPGGGDDAQPIERFRGVNVTFVAAGTDDLSGMITEIRVNMTRPFVNVIYLRHGVSVEQSPTWALEISSTSGLKFNSCAQAFSLAGQTDGFIGVGDEWDWPFWYPFLFKTNNKGEYEWSKRYNLGSTTDPNPAYWRDGTVYNIQSTHDANGAPTGYCMTGHCRVGSEGTDTEKAFLLSTDLNGNPLYFKRYGTERRYEECYAIEQVFTKKRGLSGRQTNGYIMVGVWRSLTGYLTDPPRTLLIKIRDNGTVQWMRRYTFNRPAGFPNPSGSVAGSSAWGVKQIFQTNGNPNGFIVGCEYRVYASSADVGNGIYASYPMLLRIDDSGNIPAGWPKTYYETGGDEGLPVRGVEVVLDASGNPVGYVLLGVTFAIKTDTSGAVSSTFKNVYNVAPYEDTIPILRLSYSTSKTSDEGYLFGGSMHSGNGPNQIQFMKIAGTGAVERNVLLGDPVAYDCLGYGASEILNSSGQAGGYLIIGRTESSAAGLFIKTKTNGHCPEMMTSRRTISTASADTPVTWPAAIGVSTNTARDFTKVNFAVSVIDTTPTSGN